MDSIFHCFLLVCVCTFDCVANEKRYKIIGYSFYSFSNYIWNWWHTYTYLDFQFRMKRKIMKRADKRINAQKASDGSKVCALNGRRRRRKNTHNKRLSSRDNDNVLKRWHFTKLFYYFLYCFCRSFSHSIFTGGRFRRFLLVSVKVSLSECSNVRIHPARLVCAVFTCFYDAFITIARVDGVSLFVRKHNCADMLAQSLCVFFDFW